MLLAWEDGQQQQVDLAYGGGPFTGDMSAGSVGDHDEAEGRGSRRSGAFPSGNLAQFLGSLRRRDFPDRLRPSTTDGLSINSIAFPDIHKPFRGSCPYRKRHPRKKQRSKRLDHGGSSHDWRVMGVAGEPIMLGNG